jgi:hypothetical protein
VTYEACSIVNWDTTCLNGEEILTLLVVEETVPGPGSDRYSQTPMKQRREWCWDPVVNVLGQDGRVTFRLWQEPSGDAMDKSTWEKKDEYVLKTIGGKELTRIPGKIASSLEVSAEITEPPLTDLCDVNISHYQNSADLEEGRHWTALPTAVACGFETKDENGVEIKLKVGGGTVWKSANPQANAKYLEFTGAGLGHIAEGMKEKRDMMAVLGARILEEPKKAVEAADSLAARYSGERASLTNIIRVTRELLTWTMRQKFQWIRPTVTQAEVEDKVHIELPVDFNVTRLDPKELVALFNVYLGGGISFATFIELLKRGEMLPRDRTPEQEQEAIAAGGPGQADPFVTQPNPKDVGSLLPVERVAAARAGAKTQVPVGSGA